MVHFLTDERNYYKINSIEKDIDKSRQFAIIISLD